MPNAPAQIAAPRAGAADPIRRGLAVGLALGAGLAAWPLRAATQPEPLRLRASRPLMGTQVDIAAEARDPALLRTAVAAAFERMSSLVELMSHYQPLSRVAAINLAAGLQPVSVPPELMQVLAMARRVSQRSNGAFDITIGSVGVWHFDNLDPKIPSPGHIARHLPLVDYRNLVLDEYLGTAHLTRREMRIDLGGIAKLYILEAGMDTLRQQGVENALINGGGDVVAMSDPAARPWRVGIRDPRQPARLLGTLELRRGFVASSGDYERCVVRNGRRYHHVIDPKTGYPTLGPHGVTLVGEDLPSLNGLGAAAMVLPTGAARDLIRGTRGVEGLIAGRGGQLWATPALRASLARA
jgi:thiamine biosynthesis lipoprotein